MLELVVPVVVLLVVLGVIAAVSVAALRRRRDAASGGLGPGASESTGGGTSTAEPPAEPWAEPPAAGPPPVAPGTTGAPPASPPADRRASRGEGSRRRGAAAPRVHVQPLSQETRERYLAAWQGVQSRATERPVLALSEADTIVARLLVERGLPSPEARTAADRRVLESLPTAQREALDSYRAGHALEQRNSSSRSDPDQVRQGMVHLSRAFQGLVDDDATTYGEDPAGPSSGPSSGPVSPADPRPRTGSE